MPAESGVITTRRLRKERDFFRRLLQLGTEKEIKPLLRRALRLAVDITGAEKGYLELQDAAGSDEPRRWSMAIGFTAETISEVLAALSRGVIAEAIATGQSIRTNSAKDDARFRDLASVNLNQIGAVLCAPVGSDTPIGVVYLQGRTERGGFSDQHVAFAEVFAQHLAPYADRLVFQERQRQKEDPTREAREKCDLRGIVGSSPALAAALDQVALVARLPIDVLLTGPTGAGKTLFARVVARNGPRPDGPFIDLNCAAVPESLAESELFGAVAGAHSTATKAIQGKIAAAQGGTLFLDDVADLPLAVQGKLLQFLQEKTYRPLGSTQQIHADLRIIAATNRDLKVMIGEKTFREDLYYRLHTLPILIPALVDRVEDIPLLVRHFCDEFSREPPRGLGVGRFEPAPSLLHAAQAAEWPGNIRELRHRVRGALLRCHAEGNRTIEARHMFPDETASESGGEGPLAYQEAMRRHQRAVLLEALEATDWNKTAAAERLDLSRSRLHTLIRAHGLKPGDGKTGPV